MTRREYYATKWKHLKIAIKKDWLFDRMTFPITGDEHRRSSAWKEVQTAAIYHHPPDPRLP